MLDKAFENPNANVTNANYCGLLSGLFQNAQNGITSVCDARIYWDRKYQNAWKRACEDEELSIRAVEVTS